MTKLAPVVLWRGRGSCCAVQRAARASTNCTALPVTFLPESSAPEVSGGDCAARFDALRPGNGRRTGIG